MLFLQKNINIFTFLFVLLGLYLPSNSQVILEIAQRPEPQFFCGTTDEGLPATIVEHPNRGQVVFLVYETEYFSSSGYSPNIRCEIISERLEKFSQEGSLNYLKIGTVNSFPTICAVSRLEEICSTKNLLFTLHPRFTEKEQEEILSRLLNYDTQTNSPLLSDNDFGFALYGDHTTPFPRPKPNTPKPPKPIDPPPKK